MADETTHSSDAPEKSGKKRPKTIIIIAIILVVEAAGIIGGMRFFGGPSEADAGDPMQMAGVPDEDKITEIKIVNTRLPNSKTGVTYLYDTEIYVQVKRKFEARVNEELEQFQNEIRAELTALWRTSEPEHFREPRLETLTRKVYALLSDRFGNDSETGEAIINKCVIVMGPGFRVDSGVPRSSGRVRDDAPRSHGWLMRT
jgi:hypothetical protein